ncbi:MAG: hypothetical protein RBR65_08840 [Aliarcobacter sp.]|jgi:chromosome segregation ATPase|nr:hypothetical protein [Aliarcobacter sp.]
MRNILIDNLQVLKKWSLKNKIDLKKISEKIQEQEQKIKDLKSDNVQSRDIKIQPKKEKDDLDFYKIKSDLSPNIGLDNDDLKKKIEKIETGVENIKDESEKVDIKIDNLSNSSLSQSEKDKLFEELEKDILNLKSAVEKLKEENQNLKKELELLVEKNKVESQKSNLEKENSNLKDKLEALKDKTQNSKNEFQEKTENKITYSDSKEAQKIKEYKIENQNEKER